MKHFPPQRNRKIFGATVGSLTIVIALCVATNGCSDVAAPQPSRQEHVVKRLATLAPELHGAADSFARGVEDLQLRRRMELAVARLADQLAAGMADSSSAALSDARSLLAGVDDDSAIEVAPVGLALDYIERRIIEILNESAADSTLGVPEDVPPQN
jgi:hypothetical protein